ncbi:MAG TPA: hypothetical protein VK081_09455 [Planctomycetota bacterium]|nr:hypothetical protein [Planctomycetota bacterium]
MSDRDAWLHRHLPIAVALLVTGILMLARSWQLFRDLGYTLGFAPCLGFPLGTAMVVMGARDVCRGLIAVVPGRR